MPRDAEQLNGIVRSTRGGTYEIELDSGAVVNAALRGRLKLESRTGDRVVVGDRVAVDSQPDGSITIEHVHERETELARRDPRQRGRAAKVIIANVDQVVVVFAAARPDPKRGMIDRFLVLAEANDLPAILIINKSDLVESDTLAARYGAYAKHYTLLLTSAKTGEGIATLREALCRRTSVFTGPSGVGKSTLLNAVQPGLQLQTSEVSAAVGKGRHTTTNAQLVPLECGGYVADTPGLRELGLWDVSIENLDQCFPELVPYLGDCRFGSSCTHVHEPRCAVREAVAAGTIDAERYESYRKLKLGEE